MERDNQYHKIYILVINQFYYNKNTKYTCSIVKKNI